jgi:hypothetical protein
VIFGMHNLCNRFSLSSLQTSHPIIILLQLWHTELHSRYHLLFNNVSFEPYGLEVHFPFLDSFFTFRFILAFPLLLQPWKDACQPLLDIFKMLWKIVFLSVFYLWFDVYQATQGIPSYIECRQVS